MNSKTVLVTGAAGHLGRAVTELFRERGARLVLMDRQLDVLIGAFGRKESEILVAADLLDREGLVREIQRAQVAFGPVEICCHIAGGFRMGELVHETTAATWDLLVDINARTLFNVAAAVVPGMLERSAGKFVTVGAGSALKGGVRMGAYSASKSALIRLTESMSAELKERGINVNCVLPSIIDTPDNRAAMPDADASRWVSPASLAKVIGFLTSEDAAAIHGAAVPVAGLVS